MKVCFFHPAFAEDNRQKIQRWACNGNLIFPVNTSECKQESAENSSRCLVGRLILGKIVESRNDAWKFLQPSFFFSYRIVFTAKNKINSV